MATIANDTQFIGISPTIDLTGKKSAILNAQTEPVTMADITSTVRPYKVFTALLTQSGGDDPQTITSGDLTIGVTYMMDGITTTTDFTNVGAPYNANGVYFVATGTTPNNWGVADLNFNSGAPVATVLENTIGNVWFTYNVVGRYSIRTNELTPLFTYNKTALFNQAFPNDDVSLSMLMYYVEEFQINIQTYSDSIMSDGALYLPTTIEIRVYE